MSCMKTNITRYLLVATFVTFSCLSLVTTTSAQTQPCGDIVYFDHTEPITDCQNPFMVSTPGQETVVIMNEEVTEGETIYTTEAGVEYYYPIINSNDFYKDIYFRHEDGNLVEVDSEYIEITLEDYRRVGLEYFGDAATAEPYAQYQMGEYVDTDSPAWDWDAYTAYDNLCQARFKGWRTALIPGTYTAVFNLAAVSVYNTPATPKSWLQKTWSYIIPTAHAQFASSGYGTVTFTIAEEVVEPAGASSVLFLPGIQASLLYTERSSGSEDQLWPPSALFNMDVLDLRMNTEGVSENDIYTRGAISTTAGVGDVYAGFQSYLTNLQFQGVIENWTPFAYDWRYSVTDIAENGTRYEEGVRLAINEIEYLASSSYSGKVTIIGHSNGGLLAKAIMNELADQNKTNLIDTVVFLASPQLGTPKAIGTILHGYDQADKLGGIIINAQTAREVINNMPGAYGLLPSAKYFDGLNEPLITFTNGTTTEPYRSVYGDTISTYEQYMGFIRGEDTFERDLGEDKFVPVRANSNMLDQALAMHNNELDDWMAPAGVKVVEVVGTGLPTMKSVEYREITEEICTSATPSGLVCVTESEMKPYAVLTRYGDGTVVQRSAEAYGGDKEKYFVNLLALNIDREGRSLKSIFHHNISEDIQLQRLIQDIIMGTSTISSSFISESHTEFTDEYDVELIDSPVRLLATDENGNETGIVIVDGVRVIKEEIPGSQYFEFGGTKYFVVPKDTNRTTKLYGEDYGGYTLTTAVLNSEDIQVVQTQLKNASTTPNLVAEYSNTDGEYSTVATDLDGDGLIDFETTMEGDLIEQEVSYDILLQAIKDSGLTKLRERALIILVQKAEYYSHKTAIKRVYAKLEDVFLRSASELVKHYVRKRYLTAEEGTNIRDLIEALEDKQ